MLFDLQTNEKLIQLNNKNVSFIKNSLLSRFGFELCKMIFLLKK